MALRVAVRAAWWRLGRCPTGWQASASWSESSRCRGRGSRTKASAPARAARVKSALVAAVASPAPSGRSRAKRSAQGRRAAASSWSGVPQEEVVVFIASGTHGFGPEFLGKKVLDKNGVVLSFYS
jgi:hypothetical protein